MGSLVNRATALLLAPLLALLVGGPAAFGRDPADRDALCDEDGCFVAYLQPKTFLSSWRACRERGGNLATTKRGRDAETLARLLAYLTLSPARADVTLWIGLQRQPRQCAATQPLRGFSWTTGDQDTEYTNWREGDESPGSCLTPRCVVTTYRTSDPTDNFKWTDRSCSVTVDGFVCHYAYTGMCAPLWKEGAGKILYQMPFGPVSAAVLTHVPVGSVASVLCPLDAEEQSVSCAVRGDGSVGWSREPPLCDRCNKDNGGCEHFCRADGAPFHCECAKGYRLGADRRSCEPLGVCQEGRCQFECVPSSDGDRCACPEGYVLASDEHSCLDVDECLQSPCEQLCVNLPGTFECRCAGGYVGDSGGVCEDVDECMDDPCEHVCENTPGSHVCHCYLGFSPVPQDASQCQDIDECQETGTCQQMCVNYQGSYACYCEEGYQLRADQYSCRRRGEVDDESAATAPYPWATHQPGPAWHPDPYKWNQQSQTDWAPEGEQHLHWLTDQPSVLDSDVIWVTSASQDEVVPDPTTRGPEMEEEKRDEGGDVGGSEWEQRSRSEQEASTGRIDPTPPSNTGASTTPYWYEVYEEETTALTQLLVPSTISGGAWNWLTKLTTAPRGVVDPEEVTDDYAASVDSTDSDRGNKQHPYWERSPNPKEQGTDFFGSTKSQEEAANTWLTPTPPSSQGGDSTEDVDSVQNRGPNQTSTWLLVGILVPICIFVVLMVVLGITFCTRCAVHPRSKEANNCYHWISGAHEKHGAPNPPGGAKTHV